MVAGPPIALSFAVAEAVKTVLASSTFTLDQKDAVREFVACMKALIEVTGHKRAQLQAEESLVETLMLAIARIFSCALDPADMAKPSEVRESRKVLFATAQSDSAEASLAKAVCMYKFSKPFVEHSKEVAVNSLADESANAAYVKSVGTVEAAFDYLYSDADTYLAKPLENVRKFVDSAPVLCVHFGETLGAINRMSVIMLESKV